MNKRIFLMPGKDNKEERMNFVRFWANHIKKVSDEEWSRQQNILINSQLINRYNTTTQKRFKRKLKEIKNE